LIRLSAYFACVKLHSIHGNKSPPIQRQQLPGFTDLPPPFPYG
jgi:hypothetical protein